MSTDRLARLARHLGVFDETLRLLRVGWSHEHGAFSFPMHDALGAVVGIRLRKPDGSKFSVRGGREGLFFSTSPNPLCIDPTVLLVVEGPTDCAAGMDMGFECIGRPSCTGSVQTLIDLLVLRKFDRVVIVADADGPGWTGADTLARRIIEQVVVRRVRVLPPPDQQKDLRQWKNSSNASHHDLMSWVDAPSSRTIKL
jgi:DNA primase